MCVCVCVCLLDSSVPRFYCVQPVVDMFTQSLSGCNVSGWLEVPCYAAPGVSCCGQEYDQGQCVFTQPQRCRYV